MLSITVNVNLPNPITCLNRSFPLVPLSIGLDRFHCIVVIWSESVADSVVEAGMRGINLELKFYHNSWQ